MAVYRVCGLGLEMFPQYSELGDRAKPFLDDGAPVSIRLFWDEEEIKALCDATGLSEPLAEYQLSCIRFCEAILAYGGFVLHASAVKYGGQVYLFSAPSGVGKSTHASLWVGCLEGARVINDDKPAIRLIDGVPYAYGTPWCGSGRLTANDGGRVRALYFLRRSEQNLAYAMEKSCVPYLLFESTLRPVDKEGMDSLFSCLDGFVRSVGVFGLDCNTEDGAVYAALSVLEKE